jgi:hypothetical protein
MVAGLVLIVVTASAWQLKDKKQHHADTATANNYADADTTKPRKHGNDKDDYGVRDNDGLNINIDLSGLDTTINEVVHDALKSVNVNAIVNQALQSVKQIDWDEINNEVQQSLKDAQHEIDNIDMKEIDREIKDAQQEIKNEHIIDSAEINRIVRDALRNVKISINNQRRI